MTTSSKDDPIHEFTFYTAAEYCHDLVSKIANTKKNDRIMLATMAFNLNEPLVQQILHELYAAAHRGVTVSFMVDAFPFMIRNEILPGPLFFTHKLPRHLTKTFQVRMKALEELKAQGGRYAIINQPTRRFTNPFAGRSHIKFAVINDYVFMGGCNLAATTNYLDLMAGWTDHRVANWLWAFGDKVMASDSVVKAMNAQDQALPIDATTTLLVDAGKAGQSLIFDTAMSLIDTAKKHILITCQFFPNDSTARHLAAAEARGVTVKIIYNHPSRHHAPFNILHHGVLWSEKRSKPGSFFANQLPKSHPFLHAKLLVTDQGAMLGSHNYVRAGVTFGTAESTLLSSSKRFAEAAMKALESQLSGP